MIKVSIKTRLKRIKSDIVKKSLKLVLIEISTYIYIYKITLQIEKFSILDMKSISIGPTRQRIKTQRRIINA